MASCPSCKSSVVWQERCRHILLTRKQKIIDKTKSYPNLWAVVIGEDETSREFKDDMAEIAAIDDLLGEDTPLAKDHTP